MTNLEKLDQYYSLTLSKVVDTTKDVMEILVDLMSEIEKVKKMKGAVKKQIVLAYFDAILQITPISEIDRHSIQRHAGIIIDIVVKVSKGDYFNKKNFKKLFFCCK